MLKAPVYREVRPVRRTAKRRTSTPRPTGILASFGTMLGLLDSASVKVKRARRRVAR
jgi:hypothetical protein